MHRKRIYLYLAFAVYQIGTFVFTVMVDGHLDLFGLLGYIKWFKYIAFLGLVCLVADFVWYLLDRRNGKKQAEELQKENNVLKAKIYDFQEAAKTGATKSA